MPRFYQITNQGSRGFDRWGSGQFGASRSGGKRKHKGLDVIAKPGESVRSPIEGDVVREGMPYSNDPGYKYVQIRGTGEYEGYVVKLFYVKGYFSGRVRAGEKVGIAQDLTKRYKNITNHVHMQVKQNGKLLSPFEVYAMCF